MALFVPFRLSGRQDCKPQIAGFFVALFYLFLSLNFFFVIFGPSKKYHIEFPIFLPSKKDLTCENLPLIAKSKKIFMRWAVRRPSIFLFYLKKIKKDFHFHFCFLSVPRLKLFCSSDVPLSLSLSVSPTHSSPSLLSPPSIPEREPFAATFHYIIPTPPFPTHQKRKKEKEEEKNPSRKFCFIRAPHSRATSLELI